MEDYALTPKDLKEVADRTIAICKRERVPKRDHNDYVQHAICAAVEAVAEFPSDRANLVHFYDKGLDRVVADEIKRNSEFIPSGNMSGLARLWAKGFCYAGQQGDVKRLLDTQEFSFLELVLAGHSDEEIAELMEMEVGDVNSFRDILKEKYLRYSGRRPV